MDVNVKIYLGTIPGVQRALNGGCDFRYGTRQAGDLSYILHLLWSDNTTVHILLYHLLDI